MKLVSLRMRSTKDGLWNVTDSTRVHLHDPGLSPYVAKEFEFNASPMPEGRHRLRENSDMCGSRAKQTLWEIVH